MTTTFSPTTNLLTSETDALGRTTDYTYDALTNANGTAYTWNNDGDLTSTGTSTYTWDDQNQLTGISGASTAAFTYNPFGQQATATAGGTTTSYLYDGTAWNSNVLQEQVSGTPTANLLTGAPGQIFQFTTPSGTNDSLLTGPLGSTIALAGSTGTISTSYSYTPGGVATATGASSPNTFEFNATQNTGTGLYLMGARYYNPATGTFISQDPTGFANGSTDLYGYALNDPINHSDPTGCGAKTFRCYLGQFLFGLGVGILAGLVGLGVTAIAGPIAGVVAGAVVAALGAVALNYLIDTSPYCQ